MIRTHGEHAGAGDGAAVAEVEPAAPSAEPQGPLSTGVSNQSVANRFGGGAGSAGGRTEMRDPIGHALARTVAMQTPTLAREDKKGDAADKAKMAKIQGDLEPIKTSYSASGTKLGEINDDCLTKLKASNKFIQTDADNFEAACDKVDEVLKRGDEAYELEQAVIESVQGILVAAALAVVGPEMLVVGGACKAIEAAAEARAGKLAAIGLKAAGKALEGGAGEVAEQGAGKVVDSTKNGSGKPSESKAHNKAAKFKQSLKAINDLIEAMPKLGKASTNHKDTAIAAGDLITEAVKAGAGQKAKWSAAEIEDKASKLVAMGKDGEKDVAEAVKAQGKVGGLAGSIERTPHKSKDEIEDDLWIRWMAGLKGGQKDLTDINPIEEYLAGRGLISVDGWTSGADEDARVTGAQKKWLKSRPGVGEIPDDPGQVESMYKRESKLDEVRNRVNGQVGRMIGTARVSIAGGDFDMPTGSPWPVGQHILGQFAIVKPHLQGNNILIAEWTDKDFHVMGSPCDENGQIQQS